jgi:uncharacterized RmlC-like cupin family protein
MSYRPRYTPDQRATGRFMKSRRMQQMLRSRAEDGARYAEAISPQRTGAYKAAFAVSTGVAGDRAEARLENTSDHAVPVELVHRVLARAVDHLEGKGG